MREEEKENREEDGEEGINGGGEIKGAIRRDDGWEGSGDR